MVYFIFCIFLFCYYVVGVICYDNFRKIYDVDVFVQNERFVQFKKSDVIVNEVRVIIFVYQDFGDLLDLLMGIVFFFMVFVCFYGQMVQVVIVKKR